MSRNNSPRTDSSSKSILSTIDDPIVLYYVGIALGASEGIRDNWHVQSCQKNGLSYMATNFGGILSVRIEQDDFVRVNGEKTIKHARDMRDHYKRNYESILKQINDTKNALATAEKERKWIDEPRDDENAISKVEKQTKIRNADNAIASWKLVLEEISPRLDGAKSQLDDAEEALNEALKFKPIDARELMFDLSKVF